MVWGFEEDRGEICVLTSEERCEYGNEITMGVKKDKERDDREEKVKLYPHLTNETGECEAWLYEQKTFVHLLT